MTPNERIEQSIKEMGKATLREYETRLLLEEVADSFQALVGAEKRGTSRHVTMVNMYYVLDYALNLHYHILLSLAKKHLFMKTGWHEFVKEKQANCQSVLVSKANEYASKKSRFQNFYTAQQLSGLPSTDCLLMFALKHLSSIVDICNLNEEEFMSKWPTYSQAAGILSEKFGDLYNYIHLLSGLIEEVHGVTSGDMGEAGDNG